MRALWLLPMVLAVGACDSLFDVTNPSDLAEEMLDDPLLLDALIYTPAAAAAEDYGLAILAADLISDDLMQPSTQTGFLLHDRGEIDLFNQRTETLYDNLAAARWRATDATTRLERILPDAAKNRAVGRAYFWDAVIRVNLADLFEEITFDGGPPQNPVTVYRMASELLDKSAQISKAAADPAYEAAAFATRARVHRALYFETNAPADLDRAAEYATRALGVQPNFRVDVIYQLPGSENAIFATMNPGLSNLGVGPVFVNLADPASGQKDPRVPHTARLGSGVHGAWYHQLKYTSRDADIPVSRWQEARLILAEHALVKGDLAGALREINTVRTAAGLANFQSAAADQIRAQLIHERRAEFWLELRSWQDQRYYKITPKEWVESAVSQGVNRRMPISLRERQNNTNFSK